MTEFDMVSRQRMADAGHMYTRGRQLVMKTLAAIGAPATIPMILHAAPSLVQSSLYRNLAVLQDAGLVTRVDVGDDRAFFELSERVTNDHHHHLVCQQCSTVVDISLPARAERALERALGDAAEGAGFELKDHRVDLVGVCAVCRAA
jgi:Fur family transcriptional regulator, ferric uptake regulator